MSEDLNIEYIEEAILGMMISNSDSIMPIIERLMPEDFTKKINGDVFQVMVNLYNEYTSFDALVLEKELVKNGKLNVFGGRSKIAELLENAPVATNLEAYVDILKDKSIKLRLKEACDNIVSEINRDYKQAKELLDLSQAKIFSIEAEKTKDPIVSIKSLGEERRRKIIELSETGNKDILGIQTSFSEYDKITGGLHGSDLLILAARPAVGKTAFAINLAINVAKQKKTVLFFSLEMGNEQLYNRILSICSGLSAKKIKENNLNQEELFKSTKTEEVIKDYPIYIAGDATVTVLDIKNYARKFKMNNNLDFIVIDYLQLISSTSQNKQREQQVSEISRSLKLLAKELNVPILALSQLSRGVENRSDKRPMLSDLRESGAIEQDADQVIFLHRNDYYEREEDKGEKKGNDNVQKVEVIIGKHRNGSTGTLFLSFDLSCQKFKDNIYTQGGNN